MPELEWLKLARADLLTIVDYISDDNPDAAQRVKDDIEAKAAKLLSFPKMGRPGRVEGTREFIAWTNYIIVYQENFFFHPNTTRFTCSPTVATILEGIRKVHALGQPITKLRKKTSSL